MASTWLHIEGADSVSAGGAHLVVFANEKGGSGKSTLAVHLAIAASKAGYRVAALDLDHRQRTFGRYMENRAATAARGGLNLNLIDTLTFDPTLPASVIEQLDDLGKDVDVVIADTPGRDDMNTLMVIGRADTLVTPMNDSFVDFDLIGQVQPDEYKLLRPGFYTRLVWELRLQRAKRGGNLDWVVLRNRLQHLGSRNMGRVANALRELSWKAGFRVAPALSERVAYRELFPSGLTILDLDLGGEIARSGAKAQQEVYAVLAELRLAAPRAAEARKEAAASV